MTATTIIEGSTVLAVPENRSLRGPGTRGGDVFFNEQMAFNRDVGVMLLRAVGHAGMTVCDAMTATGSRAARIANEVPGTRVTANDINPAAMPYIEANIELNRLADCRAVNRNMHSLLSEESYDCVDIDPFGSPVPFIQSAIRGCRRQGILAITATDTAPLAGAHAAKCRRRYRSEPVRGHLCHEGGLRILMCTVAGELAKADRGMKPLLSFYADHYFRTYVQVIEGAAAADRTLDRLGYMSYDAATLERSFSRTCDGAHGLGPFWMGPLHDRGTVARMAADGMAAERRCAKTLDIWNEELDEAFHYDLSELSSHLKLSPPKLGELIDALREHGRASRTHVSPTAFKTDLTAAEVKSVYASVSPGSVRRG